MMNVRMLCRALSCVALALLFVPATAICQNQVGKTTVGDLQRFVPVHDPAMPEGSSPMAGALTPNGGGCVAETEPNDDMPNAMPLPVPGCGNGNAAETDSYHWYATTTSGGILKMHDLWVVDVASGSFTATMTFSNSAADLDLYLLQQSGSSVSIVTKSNGYTTTESFTTTLAAGRYYVAVSAYDGSSSYALTVGGTGGGGTGGSCVTDATTLCLHSNRFRVTASFVASGTPGQGQAVKLTGADDSGYFWFFDVKNMEVVAKIASFCTGSSGQYGFYVSGLTDVQVTVTIYDTKDGTTWHHDNANGQNFCKDAVGGFSCP